MGKGRISATTQTQLPHCTGAMPRGTYRKNSTALLKTNEDEHIVTPQHRSRIPIPTWNGPKQVTLTPVQQQPVAVVHQLDTQSSTNPNQAWKSGQKTSTPARIRHKMKRPASDELSYLDMGGGL